MAKITLGGWRFAAREHKRAEMYLRLLNKSDRECYDLREQLAASEQARQTAESLRRFAEACRMSVGGRMDDYLDAVSWLRDDPMTEQAKLSDLAWALLQGGNVSRGDWDGFVKHWLAAALAQTKAPDAPLEADSRQVPGGQG